MIENYLPILIVFILVSGFVFVSLIVTHLVGPRIYNPIKMMPYESGVDQVGETRIRFSSSRFRKALSARVRVDASECSFELSPLESNQLRSS